MKITNKSKSGRAIPALNVEFAPGETVEVDAAAWAKAKSLPVVKSWLDTGDLAEDDAKPSKTKEPAKGAE